MDHLPRIIAHRGASTEAPEHTYAAYVAALAADADGLECDVRLTADGHLVCVHDRSVDRVSNGSGRVSSLELARLEELDFGSWHTATERDRGTETDSGANPAVEGALDGGASVSAAAPASAAAPVPAPAAADTDTEAPDRDASRVLTLRRLLDLVAAQNRRVELAIEVKHPSRYAGQVERSLVSVLDEYGWASRKAGEESPVRIMSFSSSAVRRANRLAPGVRTVFLMEPFVYRARGGGLPAGVRIAGPSIEILRTRPDSVARWHKAGCEVHVWTVDEPDDFELCLSLGVDAVITNRPRAMRSALSAFAESPSE
ncbi:glycerophosphodiester phosphodiesterase [Actinospica sp. MGRD01-02]|uniref:Glycerophosphodiester phosphodiesterase n=1 Tax=Actinospica acidithermotolerans TaxID=2828514 RepID=A0A941IMJ0_9ACTN|nr:glycerophosphodiester phosphodiesterase family protein [Actinospica acidithermotolerans]MBR7828611.1 glycerophosphodiester phosphodiesterase [Actinospica acidithermotolerans]